MGKITKQNTRIVSFITKPSTNIPIFLLKNHMIKSYFPVTIATTGWGITWYGIKHTNPRYNINPTIPVCNNNLNCYGLDTSVTVGTNHIKESGQRRAKTEIYGKSITAVVCHQICYMYWGNLSLFHISLDLYIQNYSKSSHHNGNNLTIAQKSLPWHKCPSP